MLKDEIEQHLEKLKALAKKKATRDKIGRLAALNVNHARGIKLTTEQEVEREFLHLTLPHASRVVEIQQLLKTLEEVK